MAMIKLTRVKLLFALALAAVLAACGGTAPTPLPGGSTAPPAGTLVPAPATTLTSGETLQWQVEIVQNGAVLPTAGEQVELTRAPFTIRVRLPAPLPVKLNVLDSDQNFQMLQPGYIFAADCMLALCTGMDVAEDRLNPEQVLFVDSLSTHYLYYQDPSDHRWSRAEITADGATFERDVARLNDQPVEQSAAPALYMLLLANPTNPDQIDAGELKRLILLFR